MLKDPSHLRGFIVAMVVGGGFIAMAMAFLDAESSAMMGQLIGVFVLLFGLIAIAALIAWLTRLVFQKLSKNKL